MPISDGLTSFVISNYKLVVWLKQEDATPADFDCIFNINCRG